MFAYGVFKAIYSPFKAFKEIIQKPSFIGPLLILVLFIVAGIGAEYARASKLYVQEMLPNSTEFAAPDTWTENCTIWSSNANITCNSDDYIEGNYSIQFDMTNSTTIWMTLDDIGLIDCQSSSGYNNLTFTIKWIHPNAVSPQNVSLALFADDAANYFQYNLTASIIQAGNQEWKNISVSIGPDAEGWFNSSSQASWGNIAGLKLTMDWAESARSNLSVLVDRLFFLSNNFEPLIVITDNYLALVIMDSLITFCLYWALFGFLLFGAAKLLKVQSDLKVSLIIIGYSLIAMVIMQVLFSVMYLLIPPLYLYLDTISPAFVLQVIYAVNFILVLALPLWAIFLSAIGAQTAFNTSLRKSLICAVVAFLPYYLLILMS